MRTTLLVTTPPPANPVTVPIARAHCRIDNASDDELIEGLIKAATAMAEGYLSRALITQTLLWTLRPESELHPERSRLGRELFLPRAPVQDILSFVVTDRLGNVTTLTPPSLPIPANTPIIGYIPDLALEPPHLIIGEQTPLSGGQNILWTPLQHIQIAMTAGYGDAAEDVPETIRQAILMLVAFLYEHRGDAGGEMPKAAEWLLDRHKLYFFGRG